jgi:hypothetical protein
MNDEAEHTDVLGGEACARLESDLRAAIRTGRPVRADRVRVMVSLSRVASQSAAYWLRTWMV